MKRYVISPVVGDGLSPETGFRSAAGDVYQSGSVDLLKADPNTGIPVWNFAFSRIATTGSFQPVFLVSNSYVFPDYPLDAMMAQMDSAARAAMVQSVQAYDVDGNGTHIDATHTDSESFRTVIERIARNWSPTFDANQFDASEASQ